MEDHKPWETDNTIAERLETAAAYDAHASELAARYQNVRPEGRAKDVEKALEYFGGEGPIVVELGCGPGREAAVILEHTDMYIGIDISPEMIKIAQAAHPDGLFGVSDIAGYEFPTYGVDVIFAFASLLHLDQSEVKKILSKAKSALSPGGIFSISLKNGEYRREVKSNEYGNRVFYYYTPEDVVTLAGEGYETVDIDEHIFDDVPWFTIVLRKSE